MGFTFTEEDVVAEAKATAGTYDAEVSKVEWMKNGSLMLRFKSAENGDSLCNDFLSFSDKAKFITARKLKQLGLEKVDGKYELSDEAQELVGMRVTLTLVPDDKNDKYLTPDFKSENFGYSVVDLPF